MIISIGPLSKACLWLSGFHRSRGNISQTFGRLSVDVLDNESCLSDSRREAGEHTMIKAISDLSNKRCFFCAHRKKRYATS